jgi:MFS family permease
MEKSAAKPKLFTGSYIFLILISFINSMGVSMVFTLLVDYAKSSLGATLAMAGLITGSYAIAALAMRPFSGPAVDHFNNKYLCIMASSLNVLVMLGYSIAPSAEVLLLIRIIHGASFGISSTANMTLASRYIPNERMGEGLGYYGLGQVLAMAFGPQLGVMVQEAYGFQTLFQTIACTTLVTVIMLIFFKYEHKKKEGLTAADRKFKLSFNRMIAKEAIVYAVIGSLFAFGNGVTTAFMKVMCDQRGIANYALFFTVGAVTLFAVRLIIGKLADQKGLSAVVTISLLVSTLSMVLIGFAQSLPVILAAAVLRAVGQGGGQISLQSACLKTVDPSRRGVATSTYFIGADMGQGLGPTIGGAVAGTFAIGGVANYTVTYLTAGVLLLLGVFVFIVYQKRNAATSTATAAASSAMAKEELTAEIEKDIEEEILT